MKACSICGAAALCLSGMDLEFFTMTNNVGGKELIVRWTYHPPYGPYGTISKYGGTAPWECPRKPVLKPSRKRSKK